MTDDNDAIPVELGPHYEEAVLIENGVVKKVFYVTGWRIGKLLFRGLPMMTYDEARHHRLFRARLGLAFVEGAGVFKAFRKAWVRRP